VNLSELASEWHERLVGTEVKGTVTDPVSGDSADYHWRCSCVRYSGFGDRLTIVWDDRLTGGYRQVERTATELDGETASTQAEALELSVRQECLAELELSRYDGLAGRVL